MIVLENFFQSLIAGVLIGAVYGLMCVGLGLIFGLMRVINFAQGEFLMLGMYGAFYTFGWFGLSGMFGPVLAALLSSVFSFAMGWLVHRFILSNSTGRAVAGTEGDGHYQQLILTLGVSLVLANGALLLFGNLPLSIRTPYASQAWELGPLAEDGMLLFFFNKARVLAVISAVVITSATYLFISRSRIGKTLRAAADNPDAATYMGIDVTRAHRISFSLGAAITAIAGGLVASYYPFQPYIGLEFVVIMYAGVVLGGLGSIMGPFWGGLIIGIVQQTSALFLPMQLQNGTIFVLFLLVILFRPQGLFGKNVERV
jgi:branched-chain amino acid transport system permease protein|uniref:branched-chain amino acid ABC transporter permease n=1 Tax=Yoonia sp. TaxID=2212373 RepID=UPI0040484979